MDGNRFDDLTRGFGTRRGVLKGLTSAVAGLVGLGLQQASAACRPKGYACQRNGDCCSGQCYAASKTDRNRVCGTACVPTSCRDQRVACGSASDGCGGTLNCGECNEGSTCVDGRCVCVPRECPANFCGEMNDGCGNPEKQCFCPQGSICAGTNLSGVCKWDNGSPCSEDGNCQSGQCRDEVCVACRAPGATCVGSPDCCQPSDTETYVCDSIDKICVVLV